MVPGRQLDEIKTLLARHGQSHLLAHWDRLAPPEQAELLRQIAAIDFPLLERLHRDPGATTDWGALAARAVSLPAVRLSERRDEARTAEALRWGEAAMSAGNLGVILVAGGQGTRLGFDRPKGMFAIGPVSEHSLFQILVEKVVAIRRRYGQPTPLYIMTSPATHDATVEYFDRVARFGLPESDVKFFCQGTMPAIDRATGRVLLSGPGQIALSPDGHGGMLAALVGGGLLDDIERRGVSQLFYLQVDNPLTPVGDAVFLGHHLMASSQMTTLAIAKQTPLDRLGVLVSIDGRAQVIEYSDLPLADAERRDADGGLALWAGSTAIHLFDAKFLRSVAGHAGGLPFHIAHKKVAYLGDEGQLVEPREPNAIKFERFIFDLLPFAERSLVVEGDPAEMFAPVKNAEGDPQDTPSAVRRQMSALHARWLRQVGAVVPADQPVEISPLLALDVAELAERLCDTNFGDGPVWLDESAAK